MYTALRCSRCSRFQVADYTSQVAHFSEPIFLKEFRVFFLRLNKPTVPKNGTHHTAAVERKLRRRYDDERRPSPEATTLVMRVLLSQSSTCIGCT